GHRTDPAGKYSGVAGRSALEPGQDRSGLYSGTSSASGSGGTDHRRFRSGIATASERVKYRTAEKTVKTGLLTLVVIRPEDFGSLTHSLAKFSFPAFSQDTHLPIWKMGIFYTHLAHNFTQYAEKTGRCAKSTKIAKI